MSKITISHQREFKGHKQSVYCVISDGRGGFFTAGSDGFIVRWIDPNSDDGVVFARVPEAVFTLFYDPHTDLVLAGGQYGNLYILKKNQSPKIVKLHQGAIFWIGFGPNGYISCSEKGEVFTWDSHGKVKKSTVLSHKSLRCGLKVGENWWFTGSEGRMWELNSDLEIRASHLLGSMSWFKMIHTSKWVFAVGRDAKLHRWNHLFLDESSIDAHWYSIHALSISPDNQFLATGSMDKSFRIWDINAWKPVTSVLSNETFGHKSSVNEILWLNNETLITVSDDATVRSWKLDFSK